MSRPIGPWQTSRSCMQQEGDGLGEPVLRLCLFVTESPLVEEVQNILGKPASVNEAACYLWLFLIICDYMTYVEEVSHFCGPNGRELSQISTNKKNK